MKKHVGSQVRTVMGKARPLQKALQAAKLLALILLLVYLPALVVIALAVILTSDGPPLINRAYRRANGKMVDLWEFRTECWRQWEITKVGGYLRRTNMYRLPALINVLQGDIAIGERVKPACDWLG